MSTVEQAVAKIRPRIEALAKPLDGYGGAEFDDLVQEGWIKAWILISIAHGIGYHNYVPSNRVVRNAMLDWVRRCQRRGFADSVPAEE